MDSAIKTMGAELVPKVKGTIKVFNIFYYLFANILTIFSNLVRCYQFRYMVCGSKKWKWLFKERRQLSS